MEIKRTITGTEPISVAEFKLFANTEYTDDDAVLIPSIITGSRSIAEQYTGRSFIAQTIEVNQVFESGDLDEITGIKLPFPNHTEITSVKMNGSSFTAYAKTGINQYTVYLTGLSADSNGICEVNIVFKSSGTCPEEAKTAIKNIALDMYTNRSTTPLNENGVKLLTTLRLY